MRKIVLGGLGLIAAGSTVLASGAFAGGNGAQLSGLSPQSGNGMGDECQIGSGDATNGFVMLNAPGKPGDANKLLGEVSLKRGPANADFIVNVAVNDGNDKCIPEGTLHTNGVGNGNSHIADMSGLKNGSYYVVLQNASDMSEAFASGNLSVN